MYMSVNNFLAPN